MDWSARSSAVFYRTYSRPKNEAGTAFETWSETVQRSVYDHHVNLWEGAGGKVDHEELKELQSYVEDRKTCVSGRTLWLGGTKYSQERAASQFNCSFVEADSIYSLVDVFWLLLNGSGVGFTPKVGTLHGFLKPIKNIEFVPSTRSMEDKGRPTNSEIKPTEANGYEWYIGIGDSAEAWAKSLGKLVNPPTCVVKKLVIDFSEIRGPGKRLKGYGWICNGWQPLMTAYKKIVEIFNNRAGDLLNEIDILDIVNHLGTVLSSRRSAQIALLDHGHPRWEEFAEAKKDFWLYGNEHRQQSNNSILLNRKPSKSQIRDLMKMIWDNGGSEPGFINGESALKRAPHFRGVNPCFTGDTLVYTADGRTTVRFDQLAAEGKDVPVFCLDADDRLAVRMMRHPRKTGEQVPTVIVHFDGGLKVRCTKNHKFRAKSGKDIEAKDLRTGDSIKFVTRYEPKPNDIRVSRPYQYVSLTAGSTLQCEHVEVARFAYSSDLVGKHVHHKNGNKLDNSPENLEVKCAHTHLSEHSQADQNPTFCGLNHEDLMAAGADLSRELGRRFSANEWKEYAEAHGWPQCFSGWRKARFGSISAFAVACAEAAGIESYEGVDPRCLKTVKKLREEGYDAFVQDGQVDVRKECPICTKPFVVPHLQREATYCSVACNTQHQKETWKSYTDEAKKLKEKHKAGQTSTFAARAELRRTQQLEVFTELVNELQREPQKAEWVARCKAKSVSAEMNRPSSPFPSWAALKDAASVFNHRVVRVEVSEPEDVYNGTVDEFHNYLVGGWEDGYTARGLKIMRFASVTNCAEILLSSYGFCNLCTTVVSRFAKNTSELMRVLYLIARANYRQTCVDLNDGILSPMWHQTNQALRLCGVSLTGLAMCPWLTDYQIKQMRNAAVCGTYSMADELGLPRPKLTTTIKPEGTGSKLFGCTEGLGKPLGRYIFNWINFSVHDPLVDMLRAAGYRIIKHPNDASACLICFPVDNTGCRFDTVDGKQVNLDSAVKQLNEYRRWNTLWADHNCSNTISWDISELDDVVEWLDRYWNDFVGVSWLRRADPTKTAADLGYLYLPQEVVTTEKYNEYNSLLKTVDWSDIHGIHEVSAQECTGGACPVR